MTSYNISFTATVSGSYTNKSPIEAELGVSLNKSKDYSLGAGAEVDVPKGERYMIKYRPAYNLCMVEETKYSEQFIEGYGFYRNDIETKICFVYVFSNWDFTAVKIPK